MKDIDRIFSETLAHHTTPPSAGMWERVEAGLTEHRGSTAWMRWAAVFVPVLLAAGIWLATKPEPTQPVAQQAVTPVLQPVEMAPVVAPATQAVAKAPSRKRPAPSVVMTPAPIAEPVPTHVEETVAFEEITLEPVALEEEVAEVVITPQATKPLVLVYTLDAVATPQTEDAERNTLNRVVDFARTVKHSDPIGDIRGLKDELFALDLRKKQPKKN